MLSAKGSSLKIADFESLRFRHPDAEDGFRLNQLVQQSPPLDQNSLYCNLLQCSHFSSTAVVAELEGELVGFVTAFIPPSDPLTLFVWQIAVADAARGIGLGKRMMNWLVATPAVSETRKLSTTITSDNHASNRLFEALANDWGAILERNLLFSREKHFAGLHEDEFEVRISPLPHRSEKIKGQFDTQSNGKASIISLT